MIKLQSCSLYLTQEYLFDVCLQKIQDILKVIKLIR